MLAEEPRWRAIIVFIENIDVADLDGGHHGHERNSKSTVG
jgi:hypothetical protein